MALDFSRIIIQMENIAHNIQLDEDNRKRRLSTALQILHDHNNSVNFLKRKLAISNTSWLVAGPSDELSGHYPASVCPDDYVVVACDGSHIDIDRHSPVKCYLINLGSVIIQYGQHPNAILCNHPTVFSNEQDLIMINPSGGNELPMQGNLLSIKRAVSECILLSNIVVDLATDLPTLALLDGSFILWELAGKQYPDYVKQSLLQNNFIPALDNLKESGQKKPIALASYISASRSTEVINLLRIALCPFDPPDCDLHCPRHLSPSNKACDKVAGLLDSDIFSSILNQGERSSTFNSCSSIVTDHYREHEVCFFYMKIDHEIARIEFPRWIEERGLLGQLHAMVLNQCNRGYNYPIALSEAHEQAVINSSDREQFRQLIQISLDEKQVSNTYSFKSISKRTRWI